MATTLPDYLPLHASLKHDFDRATAFRPALSKQVQELVDMILQDTKRYIDQMLTESVEVSAVVGSNLASLEALLRSQFDLAKYTQSVKSTKEKIKHVGREEPAISLETLEVYHAKEHALNFADEIDEQFRMEKEVNDVDAEFAEFLKKNNDYQNLKKMLFVIDNPEEPIPDDEEDEDLNVSGGKISLKDPISLNYFAAPVIAKRCQHTFEKESILTHLVSNNNCPINGCTNKITSSDLVEDQLMKIRVKAYLAKERKRHENVARVV
ncbi:uncharacterized protein CANTADRAFT_52067 [Suhomyces tanzawaensis NRRL Y-17324]|uniref:SP-RING-type domain-containing protein n=1 Tax=Suhomyces tanzawaensis NRRL Y-17324 TaxID=984487 RepID=A0A1E4SIG8_9ASCO|nr:uncharacterized protein CANTADRAFT_52067 [Suhomyces tanzawaensis NRRL Y-17324]ODV79289.1 hypothetical protein CANTADRAFT_52067 [Suhomyces tanzawaensis NRRL Y-17324]